MSTRTEFTDRVVLVAGAASGIGAAVAALLDEVGARVYRADITSPDQAEDRRSGSRSFCFDARDEDGWQGAIEAIVSAEARLDAVVNCVGVSAGSPLHDTSLEEWRRVVGINLDGAFLATKHAVRAMQPTGGAIVHIGSASGIRPASGAAAYSTSKAALRMLVRTAAKECRDAGLPIRVNLVSPAGVRTPMWESMPFFQELIREHGSADAAFEEMSRSGAGSFIEPSAVAKVVIFLLGDAAGHLTGVELPVDDGYVL